MCTDFLLSREALQHRNIVKHGHWDDIYEPLSYAGQEWGGGLFGNPSVSHNRFAIFVCIPIGCDGCILQSFFKFRAACLQNETAPKNFNFKTKNGPKNDPKLP